jgi:hypothetical protein
MDKLIKGTLKRQKEMNKKLFEQDVIMKKILREKMKRSKMLNDRIREHNLRY